MIKAIIEIVSAILGLLIIIIDKVGDKPQYSYSILSKKIYINILQKQLKLSYSK